MNKKLKNFVLGMVAFVATHQSVAWDSFSLNQISSADKDKPVKVLKVREYTRSEPQGTIKLSGKGSGKAIYPRVGSKNRFGVYRAYDEQTIDGQVHTLLETGANVDFQSKLNGSFENPNHLYSDLYLDLDGNPKTVEGIFRVCEDCPGVEMAVHNAAYASDGKTTLLELFRAASCSDQTCKKTHWGSLLK